VGTNYRPLIVTMISVAVVCCCIRGWSQEDHPAAGGTTAAGPAANGTGVQPASSLATNVRLKVVNGIIERANNTRRIRLAPTWDLLPIHPLLQQQVLYVQGLQGSTKPVTRSAVFKNDALKRPGTPDLGRDFVSTTPTELEQGDIGGSSLDVDAWHQNFRHFWSGIPVNLLRTGAILPRHMFGLLRDHQLIYALLKSGGVSSSVVSSDKDLVAKPVPGTQPDWSVTQFRIRVSSSPETFEYRYVITSSLERYDVSTTADNAAQEKVTIQAAWQAKQANPSLLDKLLFNLGVGNSAIEFEDVTIHPAPVLADKINQVDASGGPSRLEAYVRLFSGVDASDVIAKNILGGTRNASIITGGLVSRDKLTSLVGVNTEFSPFSTASVKPGYLLGISPSGGNDLFAGLSARTDVITLGVGLQVSEEDKTKRVPPQTGTALKGELAGVVSFDLSRLLGGKEERPKLAVSRGTVGGDLGLSSDEIAANLGGGILYIDYPPPGNDSNGQPDPNTVPILYLTQFENEKGEPVSGTNAVRVPVRLYSWTPTQSRGKYLFVPAGKYHWDVPPPYVLSIAGQAVSNNEIRFYANRWTELGTANLPYLLKRP
jgi:hypothetical protein